MNNDRYLSVTKQLAKYAVVGIASNAIGYLIYLFATYFGAPPKVAMSTLYFVGAVIGFLGNSSLTFSYRGARMRSTIRYVCAHFAGYLTNLAILVIFVDILQFPHQFVQGAAIFFVACFLFLLLKFYVFRAT